MVYVEVTSRRFILATLYEISRSSKRNRNKIQRTDGSFVFLVQIYRILSYSIAHVN